MFDEFVGFGDGAVRTYAHRQRGLGHGGQLHGKEAAALDQRTRARGLVEHHADLGRCEIERAGPGSAHGIALARMLGRDDDCGAVVEQAVGLVQGNRGEMIWQHGGLNMGDRRGRQAPVTMAC